MRALISGDQGFVARHMRPALEAAGYEVYGFDIKTGADARGWFRYAEGHWDLLVHLAAVVGGRATIEGAPLSVAVDLAIDAEMFQWALRTRSSKVVYFSSSAAYPVSLQGRGSSVALQEDDIDLGDIASPDLSYGLAKLVGEYQADLARAQGLDVLVLRPFSGYGTDQDLDYPFPSFIDRARRRADPFDIWGDGSAIRDWIHIDDVCAATVAAIEADVDGPVNLGTGMGTSFAELAELVTTAAGYSPGFHYRLEAPQGVHSRVADISAMSEFYEPQISLPQGIDQALGAVIA